MNMKFPLISLILLLLSFSPALGQERITSAQLRAKGVEAASLQPITFSHNDKLVAAFDRAPFEEKKEGTFFRVWFFKVEPDGSLGDYRSVKLPLKSLQQGEFTPDDEAFVILGNRGTTFLSIDLKSYQLTTLLEPKWGQPGFRADPAVLWTEAGKLFVIGAPYDRERFVESRTVATIRPEAPPESRFERGENISKLEKGLERLWFSNYATDRSAFFGQKYPQLTILSHWDGTRVSEFDRAWKYFGFWGNAGRLLYSRKKSEAEDCELVLYDSSNGSQKVISTSPDNFRYLFLSRDGSGLLTTRISETEGRLIPLYAREEDDWELKPVVVNRDGSAGTVAAGWMRLSSDGRSMCHLGPSGITLYTLGR